VGKDENAKAEPREAVAEIGELRLHEGEGEGGALGCAKSRLPPTSLRAALDEPYVDMHPERRGPNYRHPIGRTPGRLPGAGVKDWVTAKEKDRGQALPRLLGSFGWNEPGRRVYSIDHAAPMPTARHEDDWFAAEGWTEKVADYLARDGGQVARQAWTRTRAGQDWAAPPRALSWAEEARLRGVDTEVLLPARIAEAKSLLRRELPVELAAVLGEWAGDAVAGRPVGQPVTAVESDEATAQEYGDAADEPLSWSHDKQGTANRRDVAASSRWQMPCRRPG
jgi:hypothetical protein